MLVSLGLIHRNGTSLTSELSMHGMYDRLSFRGDHILNLFISLHEY